MNLRSLIGAASVVCACLALPMSGHAQRTPAYQDGADLVAGDAIKFITNGRYGKAGGLAGDASGKGFNPFSVTDNNGCGISLNSAVTTGSYSALCIGHDADGNGLIAIDGYNGSGLRSLGFRLNGTAYGFPGAGNGNVIGPTSPPPTAGNVVVWNGNQAVKDGGGPPAIHVATNTALVALTGSAGLVVRRDAFATAGDGGGAVYSWNASACSLNAGNGDNGLQVKATAGGCYTADLADKTTDIRVWGVVCDNSTSTGNSTKLIAAIASGVVLGMPKKTCLLDSTIAVASGVHSTIKGAGIYSSSVLKAADGLSTDYLFNITATSNLDWEGFEIDGNKSNTSGFTCVQSGLVQKMRVDLYVHDCPVHDAFVGGTDVTITGEFSRSGSLSGLALVAGTSRFSVDVIAHDVATTGVGCAACTDGHIKVECTDAGQQAPFADCATAYAPGNARIIWDVTCHTSGNHCAHIGGNDMTIRLVGDDAAQSGLFLGTKFDEEDGTITVVGTNVTGSGGQTWTNCLHSCQFGAGNDVAQMVIDGVTYNVDHVVDNTHLVLQSAPANGTYSYTLFWYGYSFNITADATIANASGGAGIYAIYLSGGHLKGAVRGSLGGVSCNSCTDVNIDVAVTGSQNHNIRIGGGTPYTTGTVTATNGSKAVVGVGTAWKSFVAPGDFIAVGTDTTVYAVDTVDSDTGLHLVSNYAGSQPGGSTYRAVEITDRVRVGGSANRSITGSGMFFADCVSCMASGMAESNASYGYAEGGLSTNNLYSGAAFDNATAPALIGAGSYYTGKP